jgi:hypothetical protein
MPDFRAKPEKPYGSRTLVKLFILAHKVIHSFCVKTQRGGGSFSPVDAAFDLSSGKFLNGIKHFA